MTDFKDCSDQSIIDEVYERNLQDEFYEPDECHCSLSDYTDTEIIDEVYDREIQHEFVEDEDKIPELTPHEALFLLNRIENADMHDPDLRTASLYELKEKLKRLT